MSWLVNDYTYLHIFIVLEKIVQSALVSHWPWSMNMTTMNYLFTILTILNHTVQLQILAVYV